MEEQRNMELGAKFLLEIFRIFFLLLLFLTQELEYHIEDLELWNNIYYKGPQKVI